MALIDYKFYEDNFVGKRISDLSDSPSSDGMTAEALKAYFDYMPKTMIALGAVNKIIDLLVSSSGAKNIGASVSGVTGTQIQAILESVKIMLDDRYTKSATDGLLDTKADNTTVNAMVKSISFNKDTGVFTIIEQGGSTYTIDTLLEKLAVNFRYDKPTQSLIITNSDGSTQTVSLSDFITETEMKSTDTISVTDTGGVITLNIKSGSITDDMLSSTLLAMIQGYVQSCASSAARAESSASNARDYSDSAANSASTALESKNAAGMSEQAAKQSKTDAADERLKAESWARGTKNNVSVPESDETYHNNSKWYSEQAAGSASEAEKAQAAAEKARDEAQEIAGGNYVTGSQFSKHTENGNVHTTPEEKNAWNNKVDKEAGKGLSSEDYTAEEKAKLTSLNTVTILKNDVSIATSAWTSDTTHVDYPFKANIPITGGTVNHVPDVMLSLEDATSGNFAPVADSYAGGVHIYAKEKPTSAMTIPTIKLTKVVN